MANNVDFSKPLVWDKSSGNFYNIGILSRTGYWIVGDAKENKKNVIRVLANILTSPHVSLTTKYEWRKRAQHFYKGVVRDDRSLFNIGRAFKQEIYLTKLEEKGLSRIVGADNLDFLEYAQDNNLHKTHTIEYLNGEIILTSQQGEKATWTQLKKDIGFDDNPSEVLLSQLEEMSLPKHIARQHPDFVLFMKQNNLIASLKEHKQTVNIKNGQPALFFKHYETPWKELRSFLRIKSWYKAEDMDLKKLGFCYVGPNGYGSNGILQYNPITWLKKNADHTSGRKPLPCGKLNVDQLQELSNEGISLPLIEAYQSIDKTTTLKLTDSVGRIYIFKAAKANGIFSLISQRNFYIEASISKTLEPSHGLLMRRCVSSSTFIETLEKIDDLQKKGRISLEEHKSSNLTDFIKEILTQAYSDSSAKNDSDKRGRRRAIYITQ